MTVIGECQVCGRAIKTLAPNNRIARHGYRQGKENTLTDWHRPRICDGSHYASYKTAHDALDRAILDTDRALIVSKSSLVEINSNPPDSYSCNEFGFERTESRPKDFDPAAVTSPGTRYEKHYVRVRAELHYRIINLINISNFLRARRARWVSV